MKVNFNENEKYFLKNCVLIPYINSRKNLEPKKIAQKILKKLFENNNHNLKRLRRKTIFRNIKNKPEINYEISLGV